MKVEAIERTGVERSSARKRCLLSLGIVAVLLAGLGAGLGASSALAADPPPILWGKEPPVCPTGSEAGQCDFPRGVAADPSNGHIFVGDSFNRRIVEFNALGQFIKAWGWGVDTEAAELESCTEASECVAGSTGSGAGQFGSPQGIAVDSVGNIYVADRGIPSNARVQKFNRKGNFLLMFGGEVNKTKVEAGGASEDEENLCPFLAGDECQAGNEGTGQGQFGEWPFTGDWITIDNNGTPTDTDDKVYVGDVERIQIFDTDGHYQSEFTVGGTVQGLDVDTAGNLYAIYGGEVHKLSPTGVPLPPSFPIETPAGEPGAATAVAVDAAGNVFAFGPTSFSAGKLMDPIFEFDPAGNVIAEFGKGEFSASTGLATNLCPESEAPGNLYVTNASESNAFLRAYGTDPIGCFKARTLPADPIAETAATLNGTVNPTGLAVSECFFEWGTTNAYGQIAQCEDPDATEIGTGTTPVPVHADLSGLQKGTVHHFRLIAKVGGETETGADVTFKTLGPPVISEEHVISATDTEATLKGLVNPEGFATTYHFEYVDLGSFEAEGFANPITTGETAIGSDRSEHAVLINLEDLAPGTAYLWRIVAKNSSGETEGEEQVLFTYQLAEEAPDPCANSDFRTEASASLPDCRAYEMVSPIDKNGGDIFRELSGAGDPGGYVQASEDGNSITYTALAAFANSPNAFNFNQYLAARKERGEAGEGWSTQGIHPPVAGQIADPTTNTFGALREFMAFTPDLCSAWLVDHQTPPPTADGQKGFANLYRRDSCGSGAGGFEALIPSPQYELPPGTPEDYVERDSVQGYSDDSSHTIMAVRAKLTPEATTGTGAQLYDRFGGAVHLVSVLPDGSLGDPTPGNGMGFAAPGSSEVGSGPLRNLDNATSGDGSRVYWNAGKLYLRQHPEQGIVVEECSEPDKACTVEVSASSATFWTASADGSKALYSEGEELYEFDLERHEEGDPEPSRLIDDQVKGVAGASEDLEQIYFVSSDELPEAGENSEGDEAIAGQPNLYLEDEGAFEDKGAFSFVGTLIAGDVGTGEPGAGALAYSVISESSYLRATRVSADGSRIAFESRAPLTGYDNTSTEEGKASVEVFAYEAGGALDCVSCNPSGARPSGVQELRAPYTASWRSGNPTNVLAAAWIPTWEQALHASNVLSGDGNRLFFNSHDALLPRDTNGAQDVYEWEAAGTGGCTEERADYFAQNGGCLYLISTGESPSESEFWEASPDGRDVFFTTQESLLPQDPGSVDLYDARVGGGYPQEIPEAPCEGEACQNPPPPPEFQTPASSTYSGPGDPPHSRKRSCPKGKRKVRKAGKVRCVKKHKSKGNRRRANPNRRAAR